jgi:hypothetical protein
MFLNNHVIKIAENRELPVVYQFKKMGELKTMLCGLFGISAGKKSF